MMHFITFYPLELPVSTGLVGSMLDGPEIASSALGHAAKLAHHLLAPAVQATSWAGSSSGQPAPSALHLAEALMEAGACTSKGWATAALRPFLPGIISGLCRQSDSSARARFVRILSMPCQTRHQADINRKLGRRWMWGKPAC
jgi:hypothetical protein